MDMISEIIPKLWNRATQEKNRRRSFQTKEMSLKIFLGIVARLYWIRERMKIVDIRKVHRKSENTKWSKKFVCILFRLHWEVAGEFSEEKCHH